MNDWDQIDAGSAFTWRETAAEDLAFFFEHQRDPVARHMAAFTAKNPDDQQAFLAHWKKVLEDENIIRRTVLVRGVVAGHVLCHSWLGIPEISYWIGREYWGQGLATWALSEMLRQIKVRPLYARAVKDNLGSIRVLEKCGFELHRHDKGFANARGAEVEEVIMRLA